MIFIETPIFTNDIQQLLSDEYYRELQHSLILNPEAGKLIQGSSGLRKIRWKLPGTGKRGSLRVIYYFDEPFETLYMLYVYKKSKQTDLTRKQVKILSNLVKEWLK